MIRSHCFRRSEAPRRSQAGKTSKQTHSKYLVRVLVLSPAEIAGPRRLPESGREVAFHDVLIFGDQG